MSSLTPMMAQWHSCKESAPGALLFFRLGDFYEAFYEDAEILAKVLDLTLTKRVDIPMAGVPYHSAENYIDRLIAKGFRVAIAEQIDNPKETKGIVRRKVIRIITPGTIIQSSLIEDKEPRYLVSLHFLNKRIGIATLDITTATFWVTEAEDFKAAQDELSRIRPKEILIEKKWKNKGTFVSEIKQVIRPTFHFIDSFHFDHQTALDILTRQFQVKTLDGFGLKGLVSAINAAGALLFYVGNELNLPTDHITEIRPIEHQKSMHIDQSTRKNLELIQPLHEGQQESTLLHLIDQTKSPMGGRKIRKWLLHPLLSSKAIKKRQEMITEKMNDFSSLLRLRECLSQVRDIERIMMRIETGYASPRDLASLKHSLIATAQINSTYALHNLVTIIDSALVDTPPMRLSDGGVFKEGFNAKLDELLTIKRNSKEWIAHYQTQLREKYNIKTLKIGYTRAFGYFIEVSKKQSGNVPPEFQRRQTLVNCERFITNHLKEFEYKILSADEKISAIEAELFTSLRKEVSTFSNKVRTIAEKIAEIDCIAGLAKLALERDYICPTIDDSNTFIVREGRHPVIEVSNEVHFIPNDIIFEGQLALITGPNMAGKSTFIRQAALIVILAQIGSFVPAKEAHIGIVDQVFSRIGASDDLARGQSTFMVEMAETANILNNVTERSLVILDEIGRGTSTYDGISIAWAVAEYLISTPRKQAKTLFATHYFEMTELADQYPNIFNLTVSVDDHSDDIVFLRKIVRGVADKSYGIHVARIAGLPKEALKKAVKKLKELEKEHTLPKKTEGQLDLFSRENIPSSSILKELENLDPNTLTPIEALQRLMKWKANDIQS